MRETQNVPNNLPYTPDAAPPELLRLLSNLIRVGVVYARKGDRVRIKSGDNITAWLPWLNHAGGEKGRSWWPPQLGEQCLLLCPSGDLKQGVVLAGIYSQAMPAPASHAPHIKRIDLSPTDHIEHNSQTNSLHIVCAKTITFTAGSTVVHITGEGVTVNADVQAKGVSLTQHVHKGVKAGGDLTGAPEGGGG